MWRQKGATPCELMAAHCAQVLGIYKGLLQEVKATQTIHPFRCCSALHDTLQVWLDSNGEVGDDEARGKEWPGSWEVHFRC